MFREYLLGLVGLVTVALLAAVSIGAANPLYPRWGNLGALDCGTAPSSTELENFIVAATPNCLCYNIIATACTAGEQNRQCLPKANGQCATTLGGADPLEYALKDQWCKRPATSGPNNYACATGTVVQYCALQYGQLCSNVTLWKCQEWYESEAWHCACKQTEELIPRNTRIVKTGDGRTTATPAKRERSPRIPYRATAAHVPGIASGSSLSLVGYHLGGKW